MTKEDFINKLTELCTEYEVDTDHLLVVGIAFYQADKCTKNFSWNGVRFVEGMFPVSMEEMKR